MGGARRSWRWVGGGGRSSRRREEQLAGRRRSEELVLGLKAAAGADSGVEVAVDDK